MIPAPAENAPSPAAVTSPASVKAFAAPPTLIVTAPGVAPAAAVSGPATASAHAVEQHEVPRPSRSSRGSPPGCPRRPARRCRTAPGRRREPLSADATSTPVGPSPPEVSVTSPPCAVSVAAPGVVISPPNAMPPDATTLTGSPAPVSSITAPAPCVTEPPVAGQGHAARRHDRAGRPARCRPRRAAVAAPAVATLLPPVDDRAARRLVHRGRRDEPRLADVAGRREVGGPARLHRPGHGHAAARGQRRVARRRDGGTRRSRSLAGPPAVSATSPAVEATAPDTVSDRPSSRVSAPPAVNGPSAATSSPPPAGDGVVEQPLPRGGAGQQAREQHAGRRHGAGRRLGRVAALGDEADRPRRRDHAAERDPARCGQAHDGGPSSGR